jgi:formyl-CoA transferase
VGQARGNHHPSISPYGLFHCKEGAVQISCGSEGLWRRLCTEFGLDPAAEGLRTNGDRVRHPDLVRKVVEDAFAEDEPDALLVRLARAGVPAGRLRSIDEVYAWDQTASQGLLVDVEHATLGRLTLPGPPLRFFDGDDRERPRRSHSAPPTLDQHGPALRAELGLDPAVPSEGARQ